VADRRLSNNSHDVEVLVDSGIPGAPPLIAIAMTVGDRDLQWMSQMRERSVELARQRGHLRS
jgi:hypothetical protein